MLNPKIKRIKSKFSASREMYEIMNDNVAVEAEIKRQIIVDLAKKIHEEFEPTFYIEDNPFIGTTTTAEVVVIDTKTWKSIENFLYKNNWKGFSAKGSELGCKDQTFKTKEK